MKMQCLIHSSDRKLIIPASWDGLFDMLNCNIRLWGDGLVGGPLYQATDSLSHSIPVGATVNPIV